MFKCDLLAFVLIPALAASAALGAKPPTEGRNLLTMADVLAANDSQDYGVFPAVNNVANQADANTTDEQAGETPQEFAGLVAEQDREAPHPRTAQPLLSTHCIDGHVGLPITPTAYVAPYDGNEEFPLKPQVAYTFLNLGSERIEAFGVSAAVREGIELGYSLMNLEWLLDDLRMHQFSLRVNFLAEDSFDLPLPAVTGGIYFKKNTEIEDHDETFMGIFSFMGLRDDCGIDYTVTASKTFPELAFGRPVILTGGLRLSEAAQLGLLGFGSGYKATFEGSVAVAPVDGLLVAYEYRGKAEQLSMVVGLQDEDDWHAVSASYIFNEHVTLTGLWGNFGGILETEADCVWGAQAKLSF